MDVNLVLFESYWVLEYFDLTFGAWVNVPRTEFWPSLYSGGRLLA